jgi:succinylarginine dihydrolase
MNSSLNRQVEFNGLPGPTHSFAGLAAGNLASSKSEGDTSNPRLAFKQALAKAGAIREAGAESAIILPNRRPNLRLLREAGFSGNDQQVIEQAADQAPYLLKAAFSSASMWTANAATVAPGTDTEDGVTRILPANLAFNLHRQQEGADTTAILRQIFRACIDNGSIEVLSPLPNHARFGDEGAANHMRFAPDFDSAGLHTFIYGVDSANPTAGPTLPARQTRLASESVARLLRIKKELLRFIQQNPAAINAGSFHNDVIANSNLEYFMLHQLAFTDPEAIITDINAFLQGRLHTVMAQESDFSLDESTESYVFNSQIINTPTGMVLIAPMECSDKPKIRKYLEEKVLGPNSPITKVEYMDTRESMKNGGGPACLRLRVVMTPEQIETTRSDVKVFLDSELQSRLEGIADSLYRDKLAPSDLADPELTRESYQALDEMTQATNLGSIYDFQK